MTLVRALLRSIASLDDAVSLMAQLGYRARPAAVDATALGLGDQFARNRLIREGQRRRTGYAVFLTEVDQPPKALATLGRRLLQNVHDRPLAVVGVRGSGSRWERMVILRPRFVESAGRTAYRVFKLEIALEAPTHHDTEVVEQLRWDEAGPNPQEQVDRAFDVEAVTRKFFVGLRGYYDRLSAAVRELAEKHPHVYRAVEQAQGPDRVAIRIISQLLFCWFLQRKGLLAHDRNYLITRWHRKRGAYYSTELEPLFYETMAVPVSRRMPGRPGLEIPFLNGGLFDRTYGDVSLDLPDELFHVDGGLLDYLSSWTFTISEETPDEVDVAVDPELLGRVFENLIADDEQARYGVVYTPRPVVQFMCREALVAWMGPRIGLAESWCRRLLTAEDPLRDYQSEYGVAATAGLCRRLGSALDELTVIDPAVGSGAFLLGMLAEIVRLRELLYRVEHGQEPDLETIRQWKWHSIEHTLFGVDIEPLALELCRLRLWLALIADLPDDSTRVPPLPNLEYRTAAADSLTDYVGQLRVQEVRTGTAQLEAAFTTAPEAGLRHTYFSTADPDAKERLRQELRMEEDRWVEAFLARAEEDAKQARQPDRVQHLRTLRERFRSQDRVFPIFVPAFHAPEVMARGKWDIVIMNPPYLGKKEVTQRVVPERRADYERHHGEKNDLMILFAYRARELVRLGGVCCMIFNDSVFTSTDATRLRRLLFDEDEVLVLARTRCFEGQAVNGGVVLWRRQRDGASSHIRWVEGYKRDPRDFAAASDHVNPRGAQPVPAGEMEIFVVPSQHYRILPHRPLFRPAEAALWAVDWFTRLEPPEVRTAAGWDKLSNTRALNEEMDARRRMGWYDRLRPGQFVPLGYCITGGQGLATADDKRFLAAIEGTTVAADCLKEQERLVDQIQADPELAVRWRELRQRLDREAALLALWDDAKLAKRLRWPRLLRIAPRHLVRTTGFSVEEREHGIAAGPYFIPFEKGDQSGETEGGEAIAAAWWRENPVVIDWSEASVQLLRQRAEGRETRRKPYFRNEEMWGQGGVTWNGVARYLRARLVPGGAIFGHMAPTVNPVVDWLDPYALLAILNSDVVDFVTRTFLGSLMHIEVGDIRRLPVPVLSPEQSAALSELGCRAVAAAQAGDRTALARTKAEVNRYVRNLYGMPQECSVA